MDYGELVTRAWNITWNNKFLWVLGFLAALTSAGSNGNSFQNSMNESDFVNNPEMAAQIGALVMLLMCVFMIIGLILWLLSVAARGGLIAGVNRIDDGEKITLGEAFSAGTSKIWRLIGVYLLAYLPLIIISIVIGVVAVMAIGGSVAMGSLVQNPDEAAAAIVGGMGLLGLCLCLLFCALIPVGFVLYFIAEFGTRAAVMEDMGIIESLKQGWQVFKDNLGPVILLWLIILVAGIIISLVLGIVLIPFSLAVFAPVLISAFSGDGAFTGLSMAWALGGSLCLGIIGALLMSVVQTWFSAIWTLAYKEFIGKSPEAIPEEKFA